MPSVFGVIDGSNISIEKRRGPHAVNYFNKKTSHLVQLQIVVDCRKFIDDFVGLPGSFNDSQVSRKFSLHHHTER